MECHNIQELLSSYIDGYLSEAEISVVERHLVDCSICRQELAELRQTVELIHAIPELQAPPELRGQVMQRIQKQQPFAEIDSLGESKIVVINKFLRWGSAAAALVMVAGITWKVYTNEGSFVDKAGNRQQQSISDVYDNSESSETAKTPLKAVGEGAEVIEPNQDKNESLKKKRSMAIEQQKQQSPTVSAPGADLKVALVPEANHTAPAPKNIANGVSTKTANLALQVVDAQEIQRRISQTAELYGGFVEDDAVSTERAPSQGGNSKGIAGSTTSSNIVVRVPISRFEQALQTLRQLGTVKSVNTDAQDLSIQYREVQNQISDLTARKEQLQLTDHSKNDANIQQKLIEIDQELGQLTAQLRYLDSLTVMATIYVAVNS